MVLNIRFDITNDIEIINEKKFNLCTNFINFISLDMESILSNEIISNLMENNYQKIISNINKATKGLIIPEIIDINVLTDTAGQTVNIQQIQKDLTQVLNTYTKFKELTEFCYFNNNLKTMTLLRRYIYYLHTSKIEEITLPKQTISSFGFNSKKKYNNENILVMLQKNSPYLYFNYQCSNINDYCTASFLQLIENNYTILKCKNCGKYFIVFNRANKLYCSRKSPQNASKTCKQYGRERAWLDRIKDKNDWYSAYRKVYQSLQVKTKRNPNNIQCMQDFDNFKTEANKWKKAVKDGAKTEEEFMYWLKEFRK